jgi:tetratricopeptide (TPR) repeat protein
MGKREYAEALEDYRKILAEYPRDARVLMIAGNAAWAAGDLQEAADDYRKCLEHPGDHPWGVRSSLLQVNAAIGDWSQFAKGQREIETAAIGGDPQLAEALKSGVLLERFTIGPQLVEVIDYPEPDAVGGVRYLFRLGGRPLSNDVFVPHLDLAESAGAFVLQQYSEPNGQKLILSYPGHEPVYQDVRAEILRLLETQFDSTKINHLSPYASF